MNMTVAFSFPVFPTIAPAPRVFGSPLMGCGLSGFGPKYSSPTPAWASGARFRTSSPRRMRNGIQGFLIFTYFT